MIENRRRSAGWFVTLFIVAPALVWTLISTPPAGAKTGLDKAALHAKHLEEGLDCTDCHGDKPKDRGVMSAYPDAKVCLECHDNVKELGFRPRKSERRNILFSHGDHLDLDLACRDCHKGKTAVGTALSTHASCKECHQEDLDATLCAKCHIPLKAIGLKALASYTHANDYLGRHPEYARKSAKSCAQCHVESYCLDCHNKHEGLKPSLKYPEKVRANLIHRGDWETAHRFEAKLDASSCLKCHTPKTCNQCHLRRGVGARGNQTHFKHPAGWMSKGSGKFHGDEARARIVTCASCHDRGGAGDCRTCHAASLGVNPHPKGWNDKRLKKSHPMCAECHSQ